MKKIQIQEIAKTLTKWFVIIMSIMVFALLAALLSKWMQDKVWMVFVLDALCCFFLWLLLDVMLPLNQNIRITRKNAIKMAIYVFIIAIILFILAAATLGLFNMLVVRLNVILLPIVSLLITYRSFKRKGVFH